MQNRTVTLSLAALLGGALGAILRQWQLSTGFEPATGLPIPGVMAWWLVWGLLAVLLVVTLMLTAGNHRDYRCEYTRAFRPRNRLGMVLHLGSGFLLLVGGVLHLESCLSAPQVYGGRTSSPLLIVTGIFAVLGGAAIILIARAMNQRKEPAGVWILLPGFASCFWVMTNYRLWAKNPVLEQYVFIMLASLCFMVSCALIAGFAFGKGRVRLLLVTAAMGVVLGLLVLGDGLLLRDLALTIGYTFYMLAILLTLTKSEQEPEEALPQNCPPANCASCQLDCPSAPAAQEETPSQEPELDSPEED